LPSWCSATPRSFHSFGLIGAAASSSSYSATAAFVSRRSRCTSAIACSTLPEGASPLVQARNDYNSAQANPQVASLAPSELNQARESLEKANNASNKHEDRAVVDHYKLQQESLSAFHIATLQTTIGQSATFASHSISLGGALVRNDAWRTWDPLLLLGPVIRHFFNTRHAGGKSPWWVWAVAAAGMFAIAWLSAAGPAAISTGSLPAAAPTFAQIEEIVATRCSMCHANEPVWGTIATAPKNILLDQPAQIHRHAKLIGKFAAWSSAMPPGNVTEMTGEERSTIAAWLAAGAANN
jgi:hypothetical protein